MYRVRSSSTWMCRSSFFNPIFISTQLIRQGCRKHLQQQQEGFSVSNIDLCLSNRNERTHVTSMWRKQIFEQGVVLHDRWHFKNGIATYLVSEAWRHASLLSQTTAPHEHWTWRGWHVPVLAHRPASASAELWWWQGRWTVKGYRSWTALYAARTLAQTMETKQEPFVSSELLYASTILSDKELRNCKLNSKVSKSTAGSKYVSGIANARRTWRAIDVNLMSSEVHLYRL